MGPGRSNQLAHPGKSAGFENLETPNIWLDYTQRVQFLLVSEDSKLLAELRGPFTHLSPLQLTFDSFETEEHQDLVTVVDGGPAENTSIAVKDQRHRVGSVPLLPLPFGAGHSVRHPSPSPTISQLRVQL